MNELDTDIENVDNSLNISDQGRRNFVLIQKDPPLYVYTYQPEEQLSASSVSIGAWDKFAKICLVPTNVPKTACDVDFLPFFYDNEELLESRPTDDLLQGVVYRGALECKKYSYANGQVGILWDEKVWCRRLYHCLSEKEKDFGIHFVNLTKEGPDWMTTIPTLLHAPHFSWRITPFKGVTDILALGRNTLSIMVSDMEAEVEAASLPGALCLEIGVEKPKLIDCLHCGMLLPRKLGELLSSMYLIGVIRSAHCDCTVTVYGWLIFRSVFSIGVELHITDTLCTVNILWRTSNCEVNMAHQFQYFLKQIG